MNKKFIKISLLIILAICVLMLTTYTYASQANTEAVEMTTIITQPSEGMIEQGKVMNVEKIEKSVEMSGAKEFANHLFWLSREYDMEDVNRDLKEKVTLQSTDASYQTLEKMANGKLYLYLGLHIDKPEGMQKIELLNAEGINLLDVQDFSFSEKLADGSYNYYLEYAFKNGNEWAQGAGFANVNQKMTVCYYANEEDKEPASSSELILTPVNETKATTTPFESYILTENSEWKKVEYNQFDEGIVGVNGDKAKELIDNISYDKNTQTVTFHNIGTGYDNELIRVATPNIHVIGENVFAELFCASMKTTITMDAGATMRTFITRLATDESEVKYGEEIEETFQYTYTAGKTIYVKKNNYLTSTKLQFKDVKKGDWFYEAVKYNTERGFIRGANDTEFKPETNISRGMMVTILWRMVGEPKITGGKSFPDVKTSDYYYNAVKWASAKGIVNGYNSGKFAPNDDITREQLAVILQNYSKYMKRDVSKTTSLSKFKDGYKTTGYAQTAVKWAVATGVISGKDKGTRLDPQGTATRAEAAAMIYNYFTRMK